MNDKTNEMPHPRGPGKWADPTVPKGGWEGTGVEDLGRPKHRCQMCESVTVRRVHMMEHPDYPEILGVGYVCAANMDGGYAGVEKREKELRNRLARRGRWLTRRWRSLGDGGQTLVAYGYRTTVTPRDEAWEVVVTLKNGSNAWVLDDFTQLDAAKLAGFDHIEVVGRLSLR